MSAQAEYSRRQHISEIGPPPAAVPCDVEGFETWAELREACKDDLVLFATKCFPSSTGLKPLSKFQISTLELFQNTLTSSGRICQIEPRGMGKTSRASVAALWSVLYGYQKFIPVFSARQALAGEMVGGWQLELEENDILYGMFPQLLWPVRALEGKHQRCGAQTYKEKKTNISWKADQLVLPDVDGEPGAQGILMARPWSNTRGIWRQTPDGTKQRPTAFITDDLQTDEDARNHKTVAKILQTVKKSILKLGGHDRTLSGINIGTPIAPDDFMEQIAADPAWTTVRYKMLPAMPTNMDLWEGKYKELRHAVDENDPKGQTKARIKAKEFYEANREKMDEGAQAAWDWCYAWGDDPPTEISSIQHAMNILIDDGPESFASECQCEPLDNLDEDAMQLMTLQEIQAKQHHLNRYEVPTWAQKLYMAVDVQKNKLYYTIGAVGKDMKVAIVDYGMYPELNGIMVESRDLPEGHDVFSLYPDYDEDAALFAGLNDLIADKCAKTYKREDGAELFIEKVGVDRGYRADIVDQVSKHSQYKQSIIPVRGAPVKASDKPFIERPVKEGEVNGLYWQRRKTPTSDQMYLLIDTNWWKSRAHMMLKNGVGGKASMSLYKAPESIHQWIASNYLAERPHMHSVDGRTKEIWTHDYFNLDNHVFDTTVYLLALANSEGFTFENQETQTKKRRVVRRKMKF